MRIQPAVKFIFLSCIFLLVINFSSAITASGSGYQVEVFADVVVGESTEDALFSFRSSLINNPGTEFSTDGYEGTISYLAIDEEIIPSSGSSGGGGNRRSSGGTFLIPRINSSNNSVNDIVDRKPTINNDSQTTMQNEVDQSVTGNIIDSQALTNKNEEETKNGLDVQKDTLSDIISKNSDMLINLIRKNAQFSLFTLSMVLVIITLIIASRKKKLSDELVKTESTPDRAFSHPTNEFTNGQTTQVLSSEEDIDKFISDELNNGKSLNTLLSELKSDGMSYEQAYNLEAKYIIKEGLRELKSREEIYNAMVKAGWDESIINKLLDELIKN